MTFFLKNSDFLEISNFFPTVALILCGKIWLRLRCGVHLVHREQQVIPSVVGQPPRTLAMLTLCVRAGGVEVQ